MGSLPNWVQVPPQTPDEQLVNGLAGFSSLFGVISFELGDELRYAIADTATARTAYFETLTDRWLATIDL